MTGRRKFLLLVTVLTLLATGEARADCTDPAKPEGRIIYNADFKVLQYCDGTDWVAMHAPGAGGEPNGCPTIGDVCSGGSVYAGLSPDGNVPMYTTPADAGQFTWNNGTSNWIDTAMANNAYVTGAANTALLVGLSDAASPYDAAVYCDSLSVHGKTDWYLPARDEINVLYTNRAAIGGFNTSGSIPAGYYWSSSEGNDNGAWHQNFSDSLQNISSKGVGLSVRCVRKTAGSGCTDPTKPEGAIFYNANHRVMQVCAGNVWRAMGPVGGTSAAAPSNGLIAHWMMEETAGTAVADETGSFTGTWTGSPSVVSVVGQIGTAFGFHSEQDHKVAIGSAVIGASQSFTISAWFSHNMASADNDIIYSQGDNADGDAIRFGFLAGSNTDLKCGIWGTTPLVLATISDNAFHHAVCTYDEPTDTTRLYIDGQLVDTETEAFKYSGFGTTEIGHFTLHSTNADFDGIIDEVRIYNRALTPPEVSNLYDALACLAPVKAQGTLIYNSSGNVMQYCDGANWVGIGKY